MILPVMVCIEEQVIFISIPENRYIKLSSLMHTVILQDGEVIVIYVTPLEVYGK
jgi:hypothetical protein